MIHIGPSFREGPIVVINSLNNLWAQSAFVTFIVRVRITVITALTA